MVANALPNTSIRHISIEYNDFIEENSLHQLIAPESLLKSLLLKCGNLKTSSTMKLAFELKYNRQLRILDLWDNNIDDLTYFTEGLKFNQSVVSINFGKNAVSDESALQLFKVIINVLNL